MFELLYLINVFCVVVSWRVAMQCYKRGDKFWGNFNIFASASNATIVVNHIL